MSEMAAKLEEKPEQVTQEFRLTALEITSEGVMAHLEVPPPELETTNPVAEHCRKIIATVKQTFGEESFPKEVVDLVYSFMDAMPTHKQTAPHLPHSIMYFTQHQWFELGAPAINDTLWVTVRHEGKTTSSSSSPSTTTQ